MSGLNDLEREIVRLAIAYEECWSEYSYSTKPEPGGDKTMDEILLNKAEAHQSLIETVRMLNMVIDPPAPNDETAAVAVHKLLKVDERWAG